MIGDNWSRPMGLPVGEPDMRDAELARLRAEVAELREQVERLDETLARIGDPEFHYSSDDDEDTQLSLRMADARAARFALAQAQKEGT